MIGGSTPYVVQTREDVLAILPLEYRRSLSAPVRDALADALLAMLMYGQDAGDFAAGQSDIKTATAGEEDALFEDRGIPRATDEEDEPYRDRALTRPRLVTFAAIRDATNLILDSIGAAHCQISDLTLDRWFIGTGAQTWHSYVGAGPSYPERYFEGNAPNNYGALYIEGNEPGGAIPGSDTIGRQFLIRVPDLTGLIDAKATPVSGTDPAVHLDGMFVGDGTYPLTFFSAGDTAATIYQAIVSTVNALVGHSMRWILFPDPKIS